MLRAKAGLLMSSERNVHTLGVNFIHPSLGRSNLTGKRNRSTAHPGSNAKTVVHKHQSDTPLSAENAGWFLTLGRSFILAYHA